jgi:LemA protein
MEIPRGVSAWELRRYFSRQVRKLRFLYKALIIVSCVVFLAIAAHVIYYFNHLTALECQVLTAQGKVGSAVQYRANLIPVLVKSVSSFVQHEGSVFYRTVDARERELRMIPPTPEGTPGTPPPVPLDVKLPEGQGSFQEALQRIMAVAEQYPALVTSEVFQLFMKQVTEAEASIRDARVQYNDRVNAYSTAAMMFPGNIYAACFGFRDFPYFEQVSESEWAKVELPSPPPAGTASGRAGSSNQVEPVGGSGPDVPR